MLLPEPSRIGPPIVNGENCSEMVGLAFSVIVPVPRFSAEKPKKEKLPPQTIFTAGTIVTGVPLALSNAPPLIVSGPGPTPAAL